MPVQMIELEEIMMVEVSDDALEATNVMDGAYSIGGTCGTVGCNLAYC